MYDYGIYSKTKARACWFVVPSLSFGMLNHTLNPKPKPFECGADPRFKYAMWTDTEQLVDANKHQARQRFISSHHWLGFGGVHGDARGRKGISSITTDSSIICLGFLSSLLRLFKVIMTTVAIRVVWVMSVGGGGGGVVGGGGGGVVVVVVVVVPVVVMVVMMAVRGW